MRYLFKLSMLLLLGLLVSCSDDKEDYLISGCGIDQQNQFVHEVMLDTYLWYQEVEPQIDYADFSSPQQLLEFLRYQERDSTFSYITSAESFDSLYQEGQYVGYGFSPILLANDGTAWIRYVFDDSPAGQAGIERGDQILSIDGELVETLTVDDWEDIFGPAEIGYPLDLVVGKADASTLGISLEKALVNINTVLHQEVLSNGTEDVGYLVFNSFLSTSRPELHAAFNDFNDAGVTKLILDLRYNGGGSVAIANELASYLQAVSDSNQDLFTRLVYNDKQQSSNQNYFLRPLTGALNLEQLIVITSGSTCSASEMIVHGLSPYLDVRTVGSTTCGKPVGMNAYRFCDNMLVPVTFAVANKDDVDNDTVGDYFAGLPAQCAADDNLALDFGNVTDPMLAEALYVSANGSCQPLAARSTPRSYRDIYDAGSLRGVIGAY
ncbi:MAG: S41 family peptidase [Gammaproteobacteria bacterium]|nr:S41 family peptidase [Gammaproteobacteria bacterium]